MVSGNDAEYKEKHIFIFLWFMFALALNGSHSPVNGRPSAGKRPGTFRWNKNVSNNGTTFHARNRYIRSFVSFRLFVYVLLLSHVMFRWLMRGCEATEPSCMRPIQTIGIVCVCVCSAVCRTQTLTNRLVSTWGTFSRRDRPNADACPLTEPHIRCAFNENREQHCIFG